MQNRQVDASSTTIISCRSARDSAALRHVQEELRRHLQTDVRLISGDDARGKIEISYYSTEDLDRLVDLLLGAKRAAL